MPEGLQSQQSQADFLRYRVAQFGPWSRCLCLAIISSSPHLSPSASPSITCHSSCRIHVRRQKRSGFCLWVMQQWNHRNVPSHSGPNPSEQNTWHSPRCNLSHMHAGNTWLQDCHRQAHRSTAERTHCVHKVPDSISRPGLSS